MGHSTDPANVHAGSHFQQHRAKLAVPFLANQVELADAGDDLVEHDHGIRGRGGLPIIAYHPRHEALSPEALLARGDETNGTPYAPGGQLCRANGDDSPADNRQYVCGLPYPLQERERCPPGQKVRGDTHRMSGIEDPRLIGPMQRGTEAWKVLYAARTASERTNRDDQEVLDKGRPPKLRGLQAFRFLGAIRTVAQLLRRALPFVWDVTYTLGKLPGAKT